MWGSALENRFACYLCSLSAVISEIFRAGFAAFFRQDCLTGYLCFRNPVDLPVFSHDMIVFSIFCRNPATVCLKKVKEFVQESDCHTVQE